MKNYCCLLFLFFTCSSFAQHKQVFDVGHGNFLYVKGIVHFDSHNKIKDTTYVLEGIDSRYHEPVRVITLNKGSFKEVYTFLKAVDSLYKYDEIGVCRGAEDNEYCIKFANGRREVTIYAWKEEAVSGKAYTLVFDDALDLCLTAVDNWKKKNKPGVK